MSYAEMGEVIGIPKRYRNRVRRRCEKLGIKRVSGREFNERYFDTWSNEMAYILGYFCADGSYNYDKTHRDITFRTSQKDKELIETIRERLEAKKEVKYEDRTKSVSLSLSSAHLCERFNKLGLNPSKSKIGFMVDVPDAYLSHFTRGYIDGDGNVSEDTRRGYSLRYRIYSSEACKEFLEYLKKKIEDRTSVRIYLRRSRENLWCLEISARDARAFTNWLYSDASIYLARKYKNYL